MKRLASTPTAVSSAAVAMGSSCPTTSCLAKASHTLFVSVAYLESRKGGGLITHVAAQRKIREQIKKVKQKGHDPMRPLIMPLIFINGILCVCVCVCVCLCV